MREISRCEGNMGSLHTSKSPNDPKRILVCLKVLYLLQTFLEHRPDGFNEIQVRGIEGVKEHLETKLPAVLHCFLGPVYLGIVFHDPALHSVAPPAPPLRFPSPIELSPVDITNHNVSSDATVLFRLLLAFFLLFLLLILPLQPD